MTLTPTQQALFNQVKEAGTLQVTIGRYKTACSTLKSLVRLKLVETDKRIGFGDTVFQVAYKSDPPELKQTCDGEWEYCGCTIQKNDHPKLLRYSVWQNIDGGKVEGSPTFKAALSWCITNRIL